MSHLSNVLDTVAAIAVMEVFVKPLTIRLVKKALRWADGHVDVIPDWLYKSSR